MTPSTVRETKRVHAVEPVALRWDTWRAWVLTNLLAEALGLGATLLVGVLLLGGLESYIGIIPVALLGVILGGLCEGSIVGSLQWLVLRRPIPPIHWREWAIATAVGAGIAWALGMLPSVLMSFVPAQSSANSSQVFNVTGPTTYLLAIAMGIALGAILGTAQWAVLRRYVPSAGWWILANAIAWAVGMALVFAGMGFIPDNGAVTAGIIAVLILFVALAGMLVGAIHGLALIWLLRERDRALFAEQTN